MSSLSKFFDVPDKVGGIPDVSFNLGDKNLYVFIYEGWYAFRRAVVPINDNDGIFGWLVIEVEYLYSAYSKV